MSPLSYSGGEEARPGDRIRYHGHPGVVEFVVTERTGDEEFDWFVNKYPGGAMMVIVDTYGRVALPREEIDDSLEFVGRSQGA